MSHADADEPDQQQRRGAMGAPLRLGLYAAVLVALFFCSFLVARAFTPEHDRDGGTGHAAAVVGDLQEGRGHGIG